MKSRKGLHGGAYKPLTEGDITKIHQASMQVFEEVGIQVNYPEALAAFQEIGAEIDHKTNIVKLKADQVKRLLVEVPESIVLHGRDPSGEHDLEIGGTKVYMGTGGTALNVQEAGSATARRAQLKDVRDMARMVESLNNIHFYMLNVYPSDLPVEEIDVNRFGAALNSTNKHIMGGVYTLEGVRNVIRMAEKIADSPEALRQKPFIS
ncbi:MAG: trimethylamine methyltransferase family protein, partial [Desulfobacteraceae bacterium]|nr:trimethylamine methyltransferase family protein [Desulfobacteraceae bacterium]